MHVKLKTNFYGLVLLLFPISILAMDSSKEPSLDWFTMIMWLLGGLAIFLYGMELLIKSLLIVAGEQMKSLLSRLTKNWITGAMTGAGVTAVIQSSSVTSVLTVGFVSAGLMTAGQAAGVIMGANLGTTITAQVIAFKVTDFALLMIAIGFVIQFVAKINKKKAIGVLLIGLGLIFFGMNVMGEGMSPLREYQPFLELMKQLQNPILAILVGFVFTALVQSSSATIGIVIVMASSGFLTLPAGIALIMGANIGTTVTAMLSTIGKSREAIRTGLIHLQFNVFGVLIFLPFIPELSQLATYISQSEGLNGVNNIDYLAANTPREIANANTIFNLINLLIFLPLIPIFLWITNRFLPINEDEKNNHDFKTEYLDETLNSAPSMAMNAVTMELQHYQQKQTLFYKRLVALIEKPNIDKLAKEDLNLQRFRNYQKQLLSYLGRVGQNELSTQEQTQFMNLMSILNHIESMLGVYESNIFSVLHRLIDDEVKPSDTMLELVGKLANEVGKSINNAVNAVVTNEQDSAYAVIAVKQTIDHLIQEALKHQVKRFKPTEERLLIFRLEMQLVDGFKQLQTLSKRIARIQIQQNEKLPPTSSFNREKAD